MFSPKLWEVLIPKEFLSNDEFGDISSLSMLVNEYLVFPVSLLVDREIVFVNVVPVL